MNKPLVSVLMTAYNRERYIAQAIESVLSQSFNNWELIILDDCSNDTTFDIAISYSAKDIRIKAFKNKNNLGQFANRNEIVNYSQGKYLKYLDSDDLLYPFAIEQLVYFMERFPEAGYGLCTITQDFGKAFPVILQPSEAYKAHYIDKKTIFYRAPLSSIIKKEVFLEAGGFPHEAVSGDFAMWNHLSLNYSVLLMPPGFVWYRVHAEQEMQKTRDNILVEFEYFKVAEYFIKLRECPLNDRLKLKALSDIKVTKAKYILWKTRTLGLAAGIKLLKFSKKGFRLCSDF